MLRKLMGKLLCTVVLLSAGGCESTAVFEEILGATTQSGSAELSSETIANGLREALTVGSGRVVSSLGAEDGFFKSAFHIPLPAKLQEARAVADKVGLSGPFDELELKAKNESCSGTGDAQSPRSVCRGD